MEVDHAIDTGERRAATLVAVRVELLLGEDITAVLVAHLVSDYSDAYPTVWRSARIQHRTHLARKRHHPAKFTPLQSGVARKAIQEDQKTTAKSGIPSNN